MSTIPAPQPTAAQLHILSHCPPTAERVAELLQQAGAGPLSVTANAWKTLAGYITALEERVVALEAHADDTNSQHHSDARGWYVASAVVGAELDAAHAEYTRQVQS